MPLDALVERLVDALVERLLERLVERLVERLSSRPGRVHASAWATGPSSDSISALRCRPPYRARMPRDTNLGARVRARKVKQVTTIQVDDPAVLRFDVELTEEYSAEVLVPRSLIGQLDGVVQGDELAVLVWLTAGAPQVQGRRVGTTWAQVFGLGTTLEVLQKLREMSPELQLNDHQLDYVCRKIDDSRSGHSAGRARIVGGVRWTPKRLACEQVDVAVVSSDLSGREAVAAVNNVLQDSAARRAALLPSNRAFGQAERLISMSTPRRRVIIGGCDLKTLPLALLKGIQEKEVYGSAGLAHPRHHALYYHGPGLQMTRRRDAAHAGVFVPSCAARTGIRDTRDCDHVQDSESALHITQPPT